MTIAVGSTGPLAPLPCPYCAGELPEAPRPADPCPTCARPVWVGSGPDGMTYLLRDGDLADHTTRWREHHERSRWVAAAEPFVDEIGFAELERELADGGRPAEPRDVYRLAEARVLPLVLESRRWDVIRDAYDAMLKVELEDVEFGGRTERALGLLRERHAAELHLIGGGRVEVIPCGCDGCIRDLGSAEVARELITQRLPHEGCRNGWCVCEYRPAGWALARIGLGRR
ncbi:MAG: hypothetical protein RL338_1208 [Chloroflexota bacterium]